MKQPNSRKGSVEQDRVSHLEKELEKTIEENQRLHDQLFSTKEKWMEDIRKKEDTIIRLQRKMSDTAQTTARVGLDTVDTLLEEVKEKDSVIAQLREDTMEMDDVITRLRAELREKEGTICKLEEEVETKECSITELEIEMGEKSEALSSVHNKLTRQQKELKEERVQHQELVSRIDTVVSHLKGEEGSSLETALWELPQEEVQTVLGTGGWSRVTKGKFRGQAVAIKCFHLPPQNTGKLRHEISIMSQLHHPNLVLLIGAVINEELLIVTELLDMSLRSTYEEGFLEEKSKIPVLRDVASALAYLHSLLTPILHRDVCSAKIFLEYSKPDVQWKAKLSDYGSANLSHLTGTHTEGAAEYAAPEVSTEDWSRQTAKIDVYSFGVLVCEVCLCQFPPERSQFPSMLSEVHHTAPNLFLLARDCTSHAHQDRPTMREVLQTIDILCVVDYETFC